MYFPFLCWRKDSGDALLPHLGDAPRLDHDLDGVVDAVAGVVERGLKIGKREGVRVHRRCIKTLAGHQCHCTVGGAAPLAADAVDIDVVADDLRDIRLHLVVREGREADFPPRLTMWTASLMAASVPAHSIT